MATPIFFDISRKQGFKVNVIYIKKWQKLSFKRSSGGDCVESIEIAVRNNAMA